MLDVRSFVALAVIFVCDAQKVNYTIGAWVPGTQENMYATMRPLFEDYLNEQVGSKQNPPIRFHLVAVDYSTDTSSNSMISKGKLDFLCTENYLAFQHGGITLLSQTL
mmetsp:Transcript_61106/g.164222  ORF Transcript_61106/g.164222 Transcript_61106/m.164222 type:complete len:108 (+) Transcript_61106:40-363(+)